MTTWPEHAARLDGLLERTESRLAAGDLVGATEELQDLSGPAFVEELPSLRPEDSEQARHLAQRLRRVDATIRAELARLRPELDLLAGADTGTRPTPRYLDHPA